YPPSRLTYMLEDSGAEVLVTVQGLMDLFPPPVGREVPAVLLLDEPGDGSSRGAGGGEEGEGPERGAAEALADVSDTSGSTGQPKGVGIAHGAAMELVSWSAEQFSAAELSGVLASTSVCFDLSVFELWVTLCLGGTVILAADALDLAELPSASRV